MVLRQAVATLAYPALAAASHSAGPRGRQMGLRVTAGGGGHWRAADSRRPGLSRRMMLLGSFPGRPQAATGSASALLYSDGATGTQAGSGPTTDSDAESELTPSQEEPQTPN